MTTDNTSPTTGEFKRCMTCGKNYLMHEGLNTCPYCEKTSLFFIKQTSV